MYEHFRNQVSEELSNYFDKHMLSLIISTVDKVASEYDITERKTDVAIVDNIFPRELLTYLRISELEGRSKGTIRFYGLRLKNFFIAVNKPLNEITANDIRIFLMDYKNKNNVKDSTLDKYRQIIHVFFKWCVAEEYLDKNPCNNIKQIKYEDSSRKALTKLQVELLRRACKNVRERAIVEVLLSTGCRIQELCNMTRSDINPYQKCISVLGKGKSRYTVYFNEASQIALDEYDDSRTDDLDWLFVTGKAPYTKASVSSIEKMFQSLSKRVGFYVCPHILRHTFATFMLQGGCAIDIVQKALNHKSVATTQRYAETLQDDVAIAHRRYAS